VWRARGPGLSGGSLLRACRPVEVDVDTQTDAFMEQLPAPIFIPMKTGVDVETQIYEVRALVAWRAAAEGARTCCRRARPPPCRRAPRAEGGGAEGEGGGGAGFVRGGAAAGCSRVCGRCVVRASGRLVRL
jgi:hypothetical protein